jgi:hypothetical protein
MEILDWAARVRAEIAAGQPVKAKRARAAALLPA